MADQLAAPALPIYGKANVVAPHLQRLGDEGVVFENCYCNYPICGPSRASMHTGKRAFDIGMYDNASEFQGAVPTFAHYLRKLGYRVEMSGKMHFVGADQMHGYEARHTTEIYPANYAWTVDWSKGREFRPTNLTMAPVIESGPCIRSLQMDYDEEVAFNGVQAVYDLGRRADEKPFFLTVSFTQPHSPFVAPQKHWDLYDHDKIDLPAVPPFELDEMDHLSRNLHYCQGRHEFTVTDDHRRNARHGYYGMISYIDEKLGQLRDALESSGQAENTIIVFCADHGEMMGERGMWYKQHFFEWASRVPLIIHAPSRWNASRIKENTSLLDLMPTILDLADDGAFDSYAETPDGVSLRPSLEQPGSQGERPVPAEFAADGSTGPSRMIKLGRFKYMDLEGVDERLYDLEEDPNELSDLTSEPTHYETLENMRRHAQSLWDADEMRIKIRTSQKRRLAIHQATGGDPTYVNVVRHNDENRYVRNGSAADTKARARFPYVEPAQAAGGGE